MAKPLTNTGHWVVADLYTIIKADNYDKLGSVKILVLSRSSLRQQDSQSMMHQKKKKTGPFVKF